MIKPLELAYSKARILIADDHPITRSGIIHIVNTQTDMFVCWEAYSAKQALEGVLASSPDLVVTDFTMPNKNGLELIKDIKALQPELPILVLSMHEESLYANRVLHAGARGYITKMEGIEKLITAIRHVLSGQIYVSEKVAARILEIFSGSTSAPRKSLVEELSNREYEIFEIIGQGLSTQQIANRLFLSVKTVDAHRANIKAKLKIDTTSELIAFAARWAISNGCCLAAMAWCAICNFSASWELHTRLLA
jgi:DNA-binding NarL/FixJ family response regulator